MARAAERRSVHYCQVYEGISMETPMARATKTTRATGGSRRGAAAVVIAVTIKPNLLNRMNAWCASRLPPRDPLGSDCCGRGAAARRDEVKRPANKEWLDDHFQNPRGIKPGSGQQVVTKDGRSDEQKSGLCSASTEGQNLGLRLPALHAASGPSLVYW